MKADRIEPLLSHASCHTAGRKTLYNPYHILTKPLFLYERPIRKMQKVRFPVLHPDDGFWEVVSELLFAPLALPQTLVVSREYGGSRNSHLCNATGFNVNLMECNSLESLG